MKRLNFLWFTSFALLFCMGFWGCRQQIILKANFEADTANGLPNINLPGEPNGDRINYTGQTPNDQIKVIQAGGNKWLQWVNHNRITNRPLSNGGRMVFHGNAVSFPAKVSYYWKLQVVEESWNGSFHFALTDGGGSINVHLVLEDALAIGEQAGFGHLYLMPSRQLLGKLPTGKICEIWVVVDHASNTFSLTATRPGSSEGVLNIDNRPLSANSTAGSKNPSIELYNYTRPPEFSGSGLANPPSGILFLDDLLINQL